MNEWKDALITGYDAKTEKFTGTWVHNGSPCALYKICVLFEVRK